MTRTLRHVLAAMLVLAVCAPGAFAQSATGTAAMSDSGTVHHATRATAHHRKRHHKRTTKKKATTTKTANKLHHKATTRKHGTTMSNKKKPVAFVNRVDINTATRVQLMKLPGVTADLADKIIAARPFGSGEELVAKGILTQDEYKKIEHRISTKIDVNK